MADVSAIAEASGVMSASVLTASREIGDATQRLRDEVGHFLGTMTSDQGFRRQYERFSGNNAAATLVAPGGKRCPATINDLSIGGINLLCPWVGDPGSEVKVELPGVQTPVAARVVRHKAGVLAVAFLQDEGTRALVSKALEEVRSGSKMAMAA